MAHPSTLPLADSDLAGLPPLAATPFRAFFLLAAVAAILLPPLWVGAYLGELRLPTALDGDEWHAHSMIFGYAGAVLAGFILTAARRWTRLPTVSGAPLVGLALLWVAGRLLVTFSAWIPAWLWVPVDAAFLPLVALAAARPIWRARSWRNAGVPLLLLVMAAGNLLLLLASAGVLPGQEHRGMDLGLFAALAIIAVIGGRVTPAFTKSVVPGVSRSFGLIDQVALVLVVAALVGVGVPFPRLFLGSALVAAGLANLLRLWGWGTRGALGVPLLGVLHVGYAWLGVGLTLYGLSFLSAAIPRDAGLHALTVGCLGTFTLGMMARVTLGHTGRRIEASTPIRVALLLITAAALARAGLSFFVPVANHLALGVVALLWTASFVLFLVADARFLVAPRLDGNAG